VEGINGVGKEFIAAGEFVALEQAAAFAVRFLEPDVVVLKIVFFGFDVAADGVNYAAVGSERERGDFFVDVLERLVEVLTMSTWNKKAAEQKEQQSAETRKPWKLVWESKTHHG
jgi:hypothetical protein